MADIDFFSAGARGRKKEMPARGKGLAGTGSQVAIY